MPRKTNYRNAGGTSVVQSGAPTRQTQQGTGARGFTSTQDVLDVPEFRFKTLNPKQQAYVDSGVDLSISKPILRFEQFKEGLGGASSAGIVAEALASSGDDEDESVLQIATEITFNSKYEFNKE